MMELVKPFREIRKKDVVQAGGKGASLGEMANAGLPVPPGFVVLASAFEKFLADTDLGVEITALLDTIDTGAMHTVEHASEKIQALILSKEMSEDLKVQIFEAFELLQTSPLVPPQTLGREGLLVAVRSSATAEDSAGAAWAGQLETYLNTTKEDLLKNIQKCWASLYTPRAIFYGFEKGFHGRKRQLATSNQQSAFEGQMSDLNGQGLISVAVVVQAMVQSEVAGIAFSVHPVTEDHNQIIIEAGYGLGEAVVNGQVTPDSYVVTKEPLEIIDKNISEQQKMLVRSEQGGNKWVPMSNSHPERNVGSHVAEDEILRSQSLSQNDSGTQKLSDEQIIELAKLIVKIENHYGFPCDIEWAWVADPEHGRAGKFYITQSRPITTLDSKLQPQRPLYKVNVSREATLVTFEVWVKSDTRELLNWIGVSTGRLILENNNGIITAYEDENFFNEASVAIVAHLKDPDWLSSKIVQYQYMISDIKELAVELLSRPDIKLFNSYFEKLVKAQGGLALVYFLPTISGVEDEVKQICLQARKDTENFFYEANDNLERAAKLLYPDYAEYIGVLTFTELSSGDFPDRATLEQRIPHFIYYDGKVQDERALDEVESKLDIKLERFNTHIEEGALQGTVAFLGRTKGRVVVVERKDDFVKLNEGDVLVTMMTTPEMVLIMQKASAIVTDEGGLTSHTAIVARELGVPCVVGTKIATQVLHDGDLVEVDAERGVVRVLERKGRPGSVQEDGDSKKAWLSKLSLYQDNYELTFLVRGVSVLVADINSQSYTHLQILTTIEDGLFKQYFRKQAIKESLEQGLKFYSDEFAFDNYKNDLLQKYNKFKILYDDLLDSNKPLTQEVVASFFNQVKEINSGYTKLNFESTDLAYQKQDEKESIRQNLEQVVTFKEQMREVINLLFFEPGGYLYRLCMLLESQFGIPSSTVRELTVEEVLRLFSGWRPDVAGVDRRQEALVLSGDPNVLLEGAEAKKVLELFKENTSNADKLSGQIANRGLAKGRVKIITIDYSDQSILRKVIESMEEGQVLVAISTSPELMVACKKASAIITDLGGMMSHAAITARELNIPCIVGTKIATQVLHDGDLVEVDAERGVVTVVERA